MAAGNIHWNKLTRALAAHYSSEADGGKYPTLDLAVARAKEMVAQGADVVEVGGQSFRPGFTPIPEEEELGRVVPVIQRLARELRVPISVDTWRASVAEQALKAGAHIVNDVFGLHKDPTIAKVAAAYGAGLIINHSQDHTNYRDVIGDIIVSFRNSVQIALDAGVSREHIVLDPGIGFTFGKTQEQHYEILRRYGEMNCLGFPLLHATSRKSFIGNLLGIEPDKRLGATIATVALGIAHGVDLIRVHDVEEMARVAKLTDVITRGEY